MVLKNLLHLVSCLWFVSFLYVPNRIIGNEYNLMSQFHNVILENFSLKKPNYVHKYLTDLYCKIFMHFILGILENYIINSKNNIMRITYLI